MYYFSIEEVRVKPGGEGEVGVPDLVGDEFGVLAQLAANRDVQVPKVVKAHAGEKLPVLEILKGFDVARPFYRSHPRFPSPILEPVPRPLQIARVHQRPGLPREDEVVFNRRKLELLILLDISLERLRPHFP